MEAEAERRERLLRALKALSPIPDDDTIDAIQMREPESRALDRVGKIVSELGDIPHESHIEPLIAACGYGDAYGLNETIRTVLEEFPAEPRERALVRALVSGQDGARAWAARLLGRTRKAKFVPA